MDITTQTLIDQVRDDLRTRRAKRAARLQLERELATYTHPAEIDDLFAVLDRYDDRDAAQIRDILSRRRVA
jgi:hypothetical protein